MRAFLPYLFGQRVSICIRADWTESQLTHPRITTPNKRAFFCNSGAEANEAAIKLTRKHAHEKLDIDFPVIITAKASFHGRTLAAITATGQPK